MENKAHNLPIDDIISALQGLKESGYTLVDAIVYGTYDLAFRPSRKKDPPPRLSLDSDTDFIQLT